MLLKLKGILCIVGVHPVGGKPFAIIVRIAGAAVGQRAPQPHRGCCVSANRAMACVSTDEKDFAR